MRHLSEIEQQELAEALQNMQCEECSQSLRTFRLRVVGALGLVVVGSIAAWLLFG